MQADSRRNASRLACIIAKELLPVEQQASSEERAEGKSTLVSPPASPLEKWCDRSDRFRDKLARSTASVPLAPVMHAEGKAETWMTPHGDQMRWMVGDATLVWWCGEWHVSHLREIGGAGDGPTLRLRLRVVGFESTADLWVSQNEWPFRLRPLCISPGGMGRLSRGHCGRVGDRVQVSLWDVAEQAFFVGSRRPVGEVVKARTERDSVVLRLHTLSTSEIVTVPNSLCRRLTDEEYEAEFSVISSVRIEVTRILSALLAGAAMDTSMNNSAAAASATSSVEPPPNALSLLPAANVHLLDGVRPGGSLVWHGMRRISGHRVYVSVLRRFGTVTPTGAATPTCATCAGAPTWYARFFDPAARRWLESTIPQDLIVKTLGSSGAWSEDGPLCAAAAESLTQRMRARNGAVEWFSEHAQASPETEKCIGAQETKGPVDRAFGLPASFPSGRGGVVLHSVKGLRLHGVAATAWLLQGAGGGDYDSDVDGCRLVIAPLFTGKSSELSRQVLVCHRCDWQWMRPQGTNAGALPGLRFLPKRLTRVLFRGLLARLDVFEGVPCLRFPHRTVYPLDFAPFRAVPPPSGEKLWVRPEGTSQVLWRACLSIPQEGGDEDLELKARRWAVGIRAVDDALVVSALLLGTQPPRGSRVETKLEANDWCILGIGPLPWLSKDQVELLCRRIVHPALGVLSLARAQHGGQFVLRANLQPCVAHTDSLEVIDLGRALLLRSASNQEWYLTARDLVSFIPALGIDPYAEAGPTALPAPRAGTGAACLGPVRFPFASALSTADEIAVDEADCAAAWEEARLLSALRDLEPLGRLALAARLVESVSLLPPGQITSAFPRSAPWSCTPPLPSSLAQLNVRVSGEPSSTEGVPPLGAEDGIDAGLNVEITPACPLGPATGAISRCTISVCLLAQNEAGADVVVSVAVPRRRFLQRIRVTASELLVNREDAEAPGQECPGEDLIARLYQRGSQEGGGTSSENAMTQLVNLLQRKAGANLFSAAAPNGAGTTPPVPSVPPLVLPPTPVPILLHQAAASFARVGTLDVSAYDTGRGVLLIARSRTGDFRSTLSNELAAVPPSDSLSAQQLRLLGASAATAALLGGQGGEELEMARYEVPLPELGFNREPLLMSDTELERLLLGCSAKPRWRERRSGLSRGSALQLEGVRLPLELALGTAAADEGLPGLVQWVAPRAGGASRQGAVVAVHPDGHCDVAVGREVYRRVAPADLRFPVRQDKKLTTRANLRRDHFPLRSERYTPVSGDGLASSAAPRVGEAVVIPAKASLSERTSTLRGLQYHRGETSYTAAVGGDCFVEATGRVGNLPEHLRLLLARTVEETNHGAEFGDDGSFAVSESASISITVRTDGTTISSQYQRPAAGPVVDVDAEEAAAAEAAYREVLERRQRLEAATRLYYSKQARKLEEEADAVLKKVFCHPCLRLLPDSCA